MDATVSKAWLTYRQAQEYAGIGRTKLWQLISSGEIEAARVGKAVRINRESIEKYLREHAYAQQLRLFE